MIVAAGTMLFASLASAAPSGTMEFTFYKAGFTVGGSGGNGALNFEGERVRLKLALDLNGMEVSRKK